MSTHIEVVNRPYGSDNRQLASGGLATSFESDSENRKPTGGEQTISSDFSPDEVALVLNKSPAIDLQLFYIKNDAQPRWTVDLQNCLGKNVSEYFGSDTVDSMLRKLGGRGTDGGSMEVAEYSKFCSAIWHFRVIPDKIDVARQVTAKKQVDEQPSALDIDGQHTLFDIVRDTQPWPLPQPHGIETKGPKSWCWNRKRRRFRERAHQLANVSLVLGWKEVLKAEIESMVWDWSRSNGNQNVTRTPLECLRSEILAERRRTELANVKLFFENRIKQSSTPTHVRKSLEPLLKAEPSSADDVYKWMRSVENSCWKPHWSRQTHAQPNTPMKSKTSLDSYHQLPQQGRSVSPPQGHSLAWLLCALTKEVNKERVFVEDMLCTANSNIIESQDNIVAELMQWRNEQVEDWKRLMSRSVANEGAESGSSRDSVSLPTIQIIQETDDLQELRDRVNDWGTLMSYATAMDRRESPILSVSREV
ncbi:hypothetical protein IFR05_005325 [Cadophora sp. M221]|nr:hypothetical protein IFR05_005325 [Cadophora sp. M221]